MTKKKKINVLNFNHDDELWLCHSPPDIDPDLPGGGHFRARSSVVWVKVNEGGTWARTAWRSAEKAMDAVLRAKTAGEAVEMLAKAGRGEHA